MSKEFDFIKQYFVNPQTVNRPEVALGSGDDCAILDVPEGYQLAISTDTLIAGTHFPENTSAFDMGYKLMAVNLSDLAAMGAKPLAVSVAATMPVDVNDIFVKDLASGFFELANQYDVQLIGGDLTAGHLSLTANIYGLLPNGQAIKRSGAKVGDLVVVSGDLGDAGAALHHPLHVLLQKLNRPQPQIELGLNLLGKASAAIDISDGLTQDLCHILSMSEVGAVIDLEALPISKHLADTVDQKMAWSFALYGGDDYQLAFTISADEFEKLDQGNLTVIGEVIAMQGLFRKTDNGLKKLPTKGFQHF